MVKIFQKLRPKNSIGSVKDFYGNFSVLVKAYAYILMMGKNLKHASENAVLNANYLKEKLKNIMIYHTMNLVCMSSFYLEKDKNMRAVFQL